jgi:hypothetical protein
MDASLSSALDEALQQAIERESFQLDPVVSRLKAIKDQRATKRPRSM